MTLLIEPSVSLHPTTLSHEFPEPTAVVLAADLHMIDVLHPPQLLPQIWYVAQGFWPKVT